MKENERATIQETRLPSLLGVEPSSVGIVQEVARTAFFTLLFITMRTVVWPTIVEKWKQRGK